MNSLYNIIRNIIFGILMFFAARYYGITGTVSVTLLVTLVGDLFFYGYRLHTLGYLDAALLKGTFRYWAVIFPVSVIAGWGFNHVVTALLPASMHFTLLIINAGTFGLFFLVLLLMVDGSLRNNTSEMAKRLVISKISKLKRA